jgi:hypothetical protein
MALVGAKVYVALNQPTTPTGSKVVRVAIHHILTGHAAEAGGVRFDIDDTAIILLAQNLTVETQAEILGELLGPDDVVDYADVVVPVQRATVSPSELAG